MQYAATAATARQANFKSYREADSQGFGLAFLHSDASIQALGATSAWCSSNMLGLEPRDRRCKSCRADQFQLCCRGRK